MSCDVICKERVDANSMKVEQNVILLIFLFSVGEPLNHEAFEWFNDVVGQKRCPLVDTWWQTGK